MTTRILLTGFGPFPGAPFNPTGPLVETLARQRHPALANVRLAAHVFPVSYEAVDRELPELLAREKPDGLLMFGLATRARHVRIESRAGNKLTRRVPDAAGNIASTAVIAPDAPAERALRAPALRLVQAAKSAGLHAVLSRDAGGYLCNYLCWRATELDGGPRLVTFVHVPPVRRGGTRPTPHAPLTLPDLVRAGDAVLRAVVAAVRGLR
jgi:pyroglutamyl-peptidase